MKDQRRFWVSLFVMSVNNIINSVLNIFDIELPGFVFIIFIVITLTSVASLFYFSIKLWLQKTESKK
ncbi:MAG: hypothetical protein IIW81_06865 [Oscillospiraceae bacterium]|nr:hypothetical protein [Oscillospiraceae bacterium]